MFQRKKLSSEIDDGLVLKIVGATGFEGVTRQNLGTALIDSTPENTTFFRNRPDPFLNIDPNSDPEKPCEFLSHKSTIAFKRFAITSVRTRGATAAREASVDAIGDGRGSDGERTAQGTLQAGSIVEGVMAT